MLGMKNNRRPVTGKYADELRAQIKRYETGHYNKDDLRRIELMNEPSEYKIVWE